MSGLESRFFAAMLPALVLAAIAASCSPADLWQPREDLKDIQEPTPGPGGGASSEERLLPAIGLIIPRSGPLSSFGRCVEDGARLAFQEAGEKRPRLVVIDDRSDPAGAEEAFSRLASDPAVLAAIGPITSSAASRCAEAAEKAALPMITPTATAFEVTRGRKFAFRACYTSPLQGAALAIYAYKHLRARTAAVAVIAGDDYGDSLADSFAKGFEGMGGRVVFRKPFGDGADPGPFVEALAAEKPAPDAVLVAAWFEESVRLMSAARASGYEGRFLGGDSWHCEDASSYQTEAVQDARFVTHFISDGPTKATARFVEKFKKHAGREPGPFDALGYDAARMVLAAAGGGTRERVREALAATKGYRGATGVITLDEDGNPVKPAIIARVAPGGPVFEEMINFQPGAR